MIPYVDVAPASTALVVAHPGHELRLFHWVEQARPVVFALTDGSGRDGCSRLAVTDKLLRKTGARPGSIFGRLTDKQLYQAVLQANRALLLDLADELATALTEQQVQVVLGDANEALIMAHDLWREIRIAAVQIAERRLNRGIAHFEFPLEQHPRWCPQGLGERPVTLRLDPSAVERKLAAACAYPELQPLVEQNLNRFGREAFSEEAYFPVVDLPARNRASAVADEPPAYERHGEQQVTAGIYPQVIRREQHLAPISTALREWVGRAA